MSELQRIDTAVRTLAEAGCRRDPATGCWITRDGLALGSDPIEAVRALRHHAIRRVVEQKRSAGEHFHR